MGTVSSKYIMLCIRQLTDQLEKKMKDLVEHITVTHITCPSFPLWK